MWKYLKSLFTKSDVTPVHTFTPSETPTTPTPAPNAVIIKRHNNTWLYLALSDIPTPYIAHRSSLKEFVWTRKVTAAAIFTTKEAANRVCSETALKVENPYAIER